MYYGEDVDSGHYACFVRTSSGILYYLNDNKVSSSVLRL